MKWLFLATWLLNGGAGYYAYNFYQGSVADLQAARAANSDLTHQVAVLKDQLSKLQSPPADGKKAGNASPSAGQTTDNVGGAPTNSPPEQVDSPFVPNSLPTSIPSTITTLSGKTYTGCTLSRVTPDGISFMHSMGVAKVLFSDLDPALAATFGYNPEAAKKYQQEQAELASKSDAERAAYDAAHPQTADVNAPSTAPTPAPAPVPPAPTAHKPAVTEPQKHHHH